MSDKKRDIKAVIFDIDGTLTSRQSWGSISRELGAPAEELDKGYARFLEGKATEAEMKKEFLDAYKATGNAKKDFILGILEGVPLRSGVEETVQYLQEKYHLLMITGAMGIYAEIISRKSGIEEYCFNCTYHWDEEGNLTDWDQYYPQEEKKLEQLDDFCKKKGITREQCVAVGDSWNDVALFDATGNGVFIESDFEDAMLEKHAWRTIHQLPELKEFL